MRKGLFEVFGEGQLGLKADDLNQCEGIFTAAGLTALQGMVIATGIFDCLVMDYDLVEGVKAEELQPRGCPAYLLSINEQILDRMEPGVPYAIRSSALSERGGTGIYKSAFFWPTGNREEDLEELWHCECIVYASEFTRDARLWRQKVNLPMGMAIMIYKVVGFKLGDWFLPPLSGTAYTSYQGVPTVRVVAGLGTQAVGGKGVVYNAPPESLLDFHRDLWDQESGDVLTLDGISQVPYPVRDPEISDEIAGCYTAYSALFGCLAKLQESGSFYFEWVAFGDSIYVIQFAPYEDKLPGDLSFDSSEYFALLESKDILRSGRASCKCVVYVGAWSVAIARHLEDLNEDIRDCLLIIPQDATSQLADHMKNERGAMEDARLAFRHFSNALAVVEKQYTYTKEQKEGLRMLGQSRVDHSEGLGASHFSQLCDRTDILFLGAQFEAEPLFSLPGRIHYRGERSISVWDVGAEVVADAENKSGFVYISKKVKGKKNEYSQHLVQGWAMDLRLAASHAQDAGMKDLSGHFYNLHYALGPETGPLGYDEFALDEQYLGLKDSGGVAGIIESIKAVLAGGCDFVNPEDWDNGFADYLGKLLAHLTKQ